MIPAGRARKCPYHGLEYDGTVSEKCPACKERDKREELEREAKEAFQTHHRMLRQVGQLVVALTQEANNDD